MPDQRNRLTPAEELQLPPLSRRQQLLFSWQRGDGYHQTLEEAVTFWNGRWGSEPIPDFIAWAAFDPFQGATLASGMTKIPECLLH